MNRSRNGTLIRLLGRLRLELGANVVIAASIQRALERVAFPAEYVVAVLGISLAVFCYVSGEPWVPKVPR